MDLTFCGQKAYKLKEIAEMENIPLKKLRLDVKNKILIAHGKSNGAWYVLENELDNYLKILRR